MSVGNETIQLKPLLPSDFTTISSSTSSFTRPPSGIPLSPLLFATHSPNPLHIASFSSGLIPAANPLVVVATNTLAPTHDLSSLTAPTTPIFSASSCQPYLNSSFLIFFPRLTLHILSQIPLPTIHTHSGLHLPIFSSNTSTPSSISLALSSDASFVGRDTMFVWPSA